MAVNLFKISSAHAGLRLDIFLQAQYADFSRAWIQKLIKKGGAKINSAPAESKIKLKTGDTIEFIFELPPEISLKPEAAMTDAIKIIFENDDFVIINKPAGLTVHPCSSQPNHTLVNWLIWKYPAIKSVRDSSDSEESKARPGIVHRLDKDTSGLMVIAKNKKTFDWLRHSFSHHLIAKTYLALVQGKTKTDKGEINLNITRSPADPAKNAVTYSKTIGRPALTRWQALKYFSGYTLLKVAPKTGRMHQIRVHLKSMGHAIAGDIKYGANVPLPKGLKRMFLHASALSFKSPEQEKFSFYSPLPPELDQVLKNLGHVI